MSAALDSHHAADLSQVRGVWIAPTAQAMGPWAAPSRGRTRSPSLHSSSFCLLPNTKFLPVLPHLLTFKQVSCTDWPGREIPASLPFPFCLGWWVQQSRNFLFTLAGSLSVLWHHGSVLLPFYPLLKFGSIYVTCVTAAAAVSVLGAMGTIADGFGWDMDFNGAEIKSCPPKKT